MAEIRHGVTVRNPLFSEHSLNRIYNNAATHPCSSEHFIIHIGLWVWLEAGSMELMLGY
jgi:hypothetical protein